MATRQCGKCNEEKPIDQFYRAGKYLLRNCKICHVRDGMARYRAKYVPKPKNKGFSALPEDKRRQIVADVAAGKMMKRIASDHNIPVEHLRNWKSRGCIVIDAPQEAAN